MTNTPPGCGRPSNQKYTQTMAQGARPSGSSEGRRINKKSRIGILCRRSNQVSSCFLSSLSAGHYAHGEFYLGHFANCCRSSFPLGIHWYNILAFRLRPPKYRYQRYFHLILCFMKRPCTPRLTLPVSIMSIKHPSSHSGFSHTSQQSGSFDIEHTFLCSTLRV